MRTKGKRVHGDIYLDRDKHERLHSLSLRTRVPMAAYLREAVEDLLSKYEPGKPRRRVASARKERPS